MAINDEIPVNDAGSRSVTIKGDLTSREPSIEGIDPETGRAPVGAWGRWKSFKEDQDYNILDVVKEISDKQHYSHTAYKPEYEFLEDEDARYEFLPGGQHGDNWQQYFDQVYLSLADLMRMSGEPRGLSEHGKYQLDVRQESLRKMLEKIIGEKLFESEGRLGYGHGGGDRYDESTEIGERIKKLLKK